MRMLQKHKFSPRSESVSQSVSRLAPLVTALHRKYTKDASPANATRLEGVSILEWVSQSVG